MRVYSFGAVAALAALFLLAPPQDPGNIYLQALGAITGLVQKDDAREKLIAAKDYEALLAILQEAGE